MSLLDLMNKMMPAGGANPTSAAPPLPAQNVLGKTPEERLQAIARVPSHAHALEMFKAYGGDFNDPAKTNELIASVRSAGEYELGNQFENLFNLVTLGRDSGSLRQMPDYKQTKGYR